VCTSVLKGEDYAKNGFVIFAFYKFGLKEEEGYDGLYCN
jgi:hypothetical protein